MLDLVASWLPDSTVYVVADSAYLGRHLLKDLPENVQAIGPIHPKASLSRPLDAAEPDRRKKKGTPLPNPTQLLHDPDYPAKEVVLTLPNGQKKKLLVQVIGGVCWHPVAGSRSMQLVLVQDPERKWRDELLLSTDENLPAKEVI